MTQQNSLDAKGTFRGHPLAELLVEIGQAKFSGSLRLSNKDQKTVIYFEKGIVIFGVSNSKALRLFNVLLQQVKIDKELLKQHPNFANDLEFTASLLNKGSFSKDEVDAFVSSQVDAIVVDALTWPEGEWHFSPLARLRKDVRYNTNVRKVLIDYARCVPSDVVQYRFRSIQEAFSVNTAKTEMQNLQPHESYVLSRFQGQSLTIEQLRGMSSLPESGLLQALYVLWLGGILLRRDWNAAFTPVKIGEILSARITKVKDASDLVIEQEVVAEPVPKPEVVMKAAELTITLDEYLNRVESAETHYDSLGLANDASLIEIKQMYFGLAKLFHPDKFHREAGNDQKRIQSAFTELSHAYETLKSDEERESYNFKMRKEIEAREKRRASGQGEPDEKDTRTETALEAFEQALVHLNNDEYDEAAVLLGRAVHYSPENAQFHAYYGQALSAFDGQLHKAEGEFQKAVKLDPKNPKIRMMLIDFFIEIDQTKRAVGELKRFLEIAPGNKEATRRLQKLAANG